MVRKKEVYDGKTSSHQQARVSHAMTTNPWLIKQLGEDWCKRELLFTERRPLDEVHPLFFHLGSSLLGDQRAIENLKFFLDKEPRHFKSLLQYLQKDWQRENVTAMLMQLQAFCFLRRRGISCIWEPPTVGSRSADLGIPLDDKRTLFLEVRTIFPPLPDRVHDKMSNWLRAEINAIPDLAYDISPNFQGCLTEAKAKYLLDAVRKEIGSGELLHSVGERVEKTYMFDGLIIAKIQYSLSEDGEGFWGGAGDSRASDGSEEAAHIKYKFLDKLEKFQLPPRPALGGYLICLDTYWDDFHDVTNAILGQAKFALTRDGKFREIRDKNGVVHHEKSANLANVDCIVVVTQPSNDWTKETMKFMMNTDHNELKQQELESLFLDSASEDTKDAKVDS